MKPEDFPSQRAGRVIRTLAGYWAFIPAPLPPPLDWTPALVSQLAEAERNLSKLAGLAGTLPSPNLLIQPMLRREAVLSSRIEGTRASLTDLYHYEAGQLELFELPDDAREVHNYVRALTAGLARLKTLPVSLRLMRELHQVLLAGVRGQHLTPGEFRRSQNWIGPAHSTIESATLVPPPVDEMTQALGLLERFIHAPSEVSPLARAGLIHYQFEALHPFLDGNGRIGRLLMTLLLCEWGLLPQPLLSLSAYFEANRPEYYARLLAVSQQGAFEEWLQYFLAGVSSEALDALARIERLQALRRRYQSQLQTERTAQRLRQALDVLFEHPVLSARQMAAALGLPFYTVQRYIARFETLGILREVTGRARNRVYRADGILRAIEAPLHG
jgi:Fic family protein